MSRMSLNKISVNHTPLVQWSKAATTYLLEVKPAEDLFIVCLFTGFAGQQTALHPLKKRRSDQLHQLAPIIIIIMAMATFRLGLSRISPSLLGKIRISTHSRRTFSITSSVFTQKSTDAGPGSVVCDQPECSPLEELKSVELPGLDEETVFRGMEAEFPCLELKRYAYNGH